MHYKLNCGTTDKHWNMMSEVAAPVVGALSKADETTRKLIINEIMQQVNEKYPDGIVNINSSAIVISGEK